jgi:hypothetical protein
MSNCVHIIPRDGAWFLWQEGVKRDLPLRYATESETLEIARRLAMRERVELIVHGSDGRVVRRERTYTSGEGASRAS